MRFGSPSLTSVLVVANVALAVGIGVLTLTRDTAAVRSSPSLWAQHQADGPPVLVVVAAGSPVDLAVARPAAELLGGAVLAVPAGGPTAPMTAALARSAPDRVLVLGGPDVVADGTAARLADLTGASVTRLSGADRFATAAKVATSQFAPPMARLRIMSGDELTGSGPHSVPAAAGAPLLFVERDRIPGVVVAALDRLRPRTIEVSGDATAVSDAVLRQLQEHASGEVVRLPREP